MIVIPARGGSKRIPHKNLQLLGEKTLLRRAIETCRTTDISVVSVSTDDVEIAEEAAAAKANIISRPPELSTDKATTDSVLIHAVDRYAPRIVVCVHCTTPFVTASDIKQAVNLYKGYGCVMAVTPFHRFVWQKFNEDFKCINMSNRPMTQDWPPQYIETGLVHVVGAKDLIKYGTRVIHPIVPLVIPEERSLDIDTIEDLEYARWLEGRK